MILRKVFQVFVTTWPDASNVRFRFFCQNSICLCQNLWVQLVEATWKPWIRRGIDSSYETPQNWLFGANNLFLHVVFLYDLLKIFFLKILKDMNPFCGATDTPILDFWWRLLLVSKPEWVLPYSSLAEAYVLCYTFNLQPSNNVPWDSPSKALVGLETGVILIYLF